MDIRILIRTFVVCFFPYPDNKIKVLSCSNLCDRSFVVVVVVFGKLYAHLGA